MKDFVLSGFFPEKWVEKYPNWVFLYPFLPDLGDVKN